MFKSEASDQSLLDILGERLERRRLGLDLTQADLAREAGVSKRTVERLERGASVQLTNLLRVLRALGLLGGLDHLIPESGPRPLELLQHAGTPRKRARSRNRDEERGDSPWSWDDDE